MKSGIKYYIVVFLATLSITGIAIAQQNHVDRLAVPFSDPSKPGTIEVSLVNGGISITGYRGKEVIVEAATRLEKLTDEVDEDERRNKAKGLRKLQYTATGLEIEEDNNVMDIGVQSWQRTIDLTIQVPVNTNLDLNCVNDGDITVENIQGNIEVNNTNGGVKLTNVSGSVVAHALNEDLVVVFTKVNPDKNMSFSSLNGDIDVTMPANIKADVKMKSDNGDIYSDFDISLKQSAPNKIVEESGKKGGKYRVRIDKNLYGTINGGGPEYVFSSFNGDIFIRKGK